MIGSHNSIVAPIGHLKKTYAYIIILDHASGNWRGPIGGPSRGILVLHVSLDQSHVRHTRER